MTFTNPTFKNQGDCVSYLFGSSLKVMSTSSYRGFDIPLAPFPEHVAVHPDGKRVYVTHQFGGGQVSVIDFGSLTVTAIALANPSDLSVTPDGSRVYVSHAPDDTVTAIDTATSTVVAARHRGA